MSLTDNIDTIKDSVVAIGIKDPTNTGKLRIIGSGFAISNDGKILTAAHILAPLDDAQKDNLVCMVLSSKETLDTYKWIPAVLEKIETKHDLALLRVSEYEDTLLKAAILGQAEEVREGKEIYFTGFPYAADLINLGFGVTLIVNRGIISSVKRKSENPHPLDWFIVDGVSNPGNSGCPLIDMDTNRVIGVMTISFGKQSKAVPQLDIKETMHIAGAKPITLVESL